MSGASRMSLDDLLTSRRGNGPTAVSERLAPVIGRAIRDSDLSQTEIAERMGLAQSMVSCWRSGKTTPALAQLLALDETCGKPRGWIIHQAGLLDINLDLQLSEPEQSIYLLRDELIQARREATEWQLEALVMFGTLPGMDRSEWVRKFSRKIDVLPAGEPSISDCIEEADRD